MDTAPAIDDGRGGTAKILPLMPGAELSMAEESVAAALHGEAQRPKSRRALLGCLPHGHPPPHRLRHLSAVRSITMH